MESWEGHSGFDFSHLGEGCLPCFQVETDLTFRIEIAGKG